MAVSDLSSRAEPVKEEPTDEQCEDFKRIALENVIKDPSVVAYVCLALHQDGGASISTSKVEECEIMTEARRLKQHMNKAYQSRVPQKKASRLPRRRPHRPTRAKPNANPAMDRKFVLQQRKLRSTPSESPAGDASVDVKAIQSKETDAVHPSSSTDQDQAKSFCISDEASVLEFYKFCFDEMQQQTVKRIAKAWIKGICPRKQAVFPYHSSSEGPGWWPPAHICPFKEPDHIKKEERLELCLHLLRLRPTPAALKEWNDNCVEPHPTHINEGWTVFLKQCASPNSLHDPRERPESAEKRAKYLDLLYDMAQHEEDYLVEGIDASHRIQWPEEYLRSSRFCSKQPVADEAVKNIAPKRKRQQHAEPKGDKKSSPEGKRARMNDRVGHKIQDLEDDSSRDASAEPDDAPQSSATTAVSKTTPQQQADDHHCMDNFDDGQDLMSQAMLKYSLTHSSTWPQERERAGLRLLNDFLDNSFNSTASSSFCPPSATSSFVTDEPNSMTWSASNIQDSLQGLHFTNASQDSLPTAPTLSTRFLDTVPNSPVLSCTDLSIPKMEREQYDGNTSSRHPWALDTAPPFYDPFCSAPSHMSALQAECVDFNTNNVSQSLFPPSTLSRGPLSRLSALDTLTAEFKSEAQSLQFGNFI